MTNNNEKEVEKSSESPQISLLGEILFIAVLVLTMIFLNKIEDSSILKLLDIISFVVSIYLKLRPKLKSISFKFDKLSIEISEDKPVILYVYEYQIFSWIYVPFMTFITFYILVKGLLLNIH